MALKMLMEGMSLRATARLTGLDKDTVQRIMEQAGQQCAQFMADTMRDLPIDDIQVDEIWSFVGMKEKTAFSQGGHEDAGDCYTFTAIDRESKLLITYHCGQRTGDDAMLFSRKLAACISNDLRPHVSTDGYRLYCVSIPDAFDYCVNLGRSSRNSEPRYRPSVVGTRQPR